MPDLSRRHFIASAATLAGLGGLASACADPVAAAACDGYDALAPQDLASREALKYVDQSPKPAELCTNCRLYNAPAGGSPCGGCQLFQGPVAPLGWCASWAPVRS